MKGISIGGLTTELRDYFTSAIQSGPYNQAKVSSLTREYSKSSHPSAPNILRLLEAMTLFMSATDPCDPYPALREKNKIPLLDIFKKIVAAFDKATTIGFVS